MDYLQIKNKSKVLTHWEEKCVDKLKTFLCPSDTYTLIEIPDYQDILDLLYHADTLRMKWLAQHPWGCYVDLDCYIKDKFIPPNNGKCYFPKVTNRIDIFYIFTNGNSKFIKNNFPKYNRENFYGWPESELIRILQEGKCNIIPDEYFTHTFNSLKPFILKQRGAKCQVHI